MAGIWEGKERGQVGFWGILGVVWVVGERGEAETLKIAQIFDWVEAFIRWNIIYLCFLITILRKDLPSLLVFLLFSRSPKFKFI
jgi:hypothetical protein